MMQRSIFLFGYFALNFAAFLAILLKKYNNFKNV